ncbi:MAG: PilW family protein [Halieaceae bacterium]|nr:PilW family protein [Halieaceae bacterium]
MPTTVCMQRRQRGMSLIELMVAMGLGLFLIAGVVNVFLANKSSTQLETSLARLQENGRIALDLLVADIRDANYIGCNSGNGSLTVLATGVTWNGVEGFERRTAGWAPPLGAVLNVAIGSTNRTGSDVLSLQHGRTLVNPTSAAIVPGSTAIPVAGNAECVRQNDLVVVSNCVTAHLIRVTNTPACDGSATSYEYALGSNNPASIEPGYPPNTEVMQFFEKTWYVRDTGRERNDIPVFALYRIENNVEEEMVEGVEYLQVLYGQELASGNIRYVPASDASLVLDEVVGIRVGILMQSFEPVRDAADTAAYQVLDESIGSSGTTYTHNGDRALRRVFQTTVLFRN